MSSSPRNPVSESEKLFKARHIIVDEIVGRETLIAEKKRKIEVYCKQTWAEIELLQDEIITLKRDMRCMDNVISNQELIITNDRKKAPMNSVPVCVKNGVATPAFLMAFLHAETMDGTYFWSPATKLQKAFHVIHKTGDARASLEFQTVMKNSCTLCGLDTYNLTQSEDLMFGTTHRACPFCQTTVRWAEIKTKMAERLVNKYIEACMSPLRPLLLLAHHVDPDSLLHKDRLAPDVFKIIMNMVFKWKVSANFRVS